MTFVRPLHTYLLDQLPLNFLFGGLIPHIKHLSHSSAHECYGQIKLLYHILVSNIIIIVKVKYAMENIKCMSTEMKVNIINTSAVMVWVCQLQPVISIKTMLSA